MTEWFKVVSLNLTMGYSIIGSNPIFSVYKLLILMKWDYSILLIIVGIIKSLYYTGITFKVDKIRILCLLERLKIYKNI